MSTPWAGMVRSYEVIPDNSRMSSRGVTTQMLIDALKSNNRNDGAGRLTEGEEALLVRAEGRIKDIEDVRSIVVTTQNGVTITVADVADVRIGALTRYGAVSQNGRTRWRKAGAQPARGQCPARLWRALKRKSRKSSQPCQRASRVTCSTIAAIWSTGQSTPSSKPCWKPWCWC